jgi:hypothetical protein
MKNKGGAEQLIGLTAKTRRRKDQVLLVFVRENAKACVSVERVLPQRLGGVCVRGHNGLCFR